uniref:Uncharacterized protein n=1 Tax=Leersia perrieri TaxID=77586 RepID=A0A0D9XSL3_9ORYZ
MSGYLRFATFLLYCVFIICLILNITLAGGSNRAFFFLVSCLLLVNQNLDLFCRIIYVSIPIDDIDVGETLPGNGGWTLDIGSLTDAKLLLTLPFNMSSVLGLLCAIYSLAQYTISWWIGISGMKYI